MTPREQISAARRWVVAGIAARVAFTALAAGVGIIVIASVLDVAVAIPRGVRSYVPLLAILGGLTAIIPLVVRATAVKSDQAIALWIEGHQPLDYLLVTAADEAERSNPQVSAALSGVDLQPGVRRAVARGTQPSALAAILLLSALLIIPAGSIRRVVAARPGDVLDRPGAGGTASRLRPLVVHYTPPAYVAGERVTLEDPESVRGLEGGSIEVLGLGSWRAAFTMPATPRVVRLEDGTDTRLLALEPIRDSLPFVNLMTPAGDTVVRAASGRLQLRASMTDDYGLADAWFEYIATSGSGELFQFRSGRIGRTDGQTGGRADSIQASLNLDSMKLGAGDVLHIRAVARDRGPSSRGAGSSETRTYRVVRPNDLDTAQVVALPSIPGDTSALSERLLIQLTEALEARRPRLSRQVVQQESRSISRDQARLRRQVADVIFMRLSGESPAEETGGVEQGDSALTPEALLAAAEAATGNGDSAALDFAEEESPVVAINRPLLEAYNAMWDATRELDMAALAQALPHMYKALDAIQRARAAERVYLRAPAQRGVVNLAQVRLTGKQDGVVVAERTAGLSDGRTEWLARLLGIVGRSDGRTVMRDSLLVLRIELLADVPAAAAALNEAIAALRTSADPAPSLNVARQALIGPSDRPTVRPSPSAWSAW